MKAYEIDSTNFLVIEQLASLAYELNIKLDAEKYLLKIIEQNPYNEDLYYYLSDIMLKNDDRYLSLKYAIMGLEKFPNSQNLMSLIEQNNRINL
jgi:hypothetical protein